MIHCHGHRQRDVHTRSPNASQPNFVTCSEVDQSCKCTSKISKVPSPITRSPKLPIFGCFYSDIVSYLSLSANIFRKKGHIIHKRKKDLSASKGRRHSSQIWGTLAYKRLTLIARMARIAQKRSSDCNSATIATMSLISCFRRRKIVFLRTYIRSWL